MIVGRFKIAFGCRSTVIVWKRLTRQYITLKFILNNHIEYMISRKKYKYLLKFSLDSFRNILVDQRQLNS